MYLCILTAFYENFLSKTHFIYISMSYLISKHKQDKQYSLWQLLWLALYKWNWILLNFTQLNWNVAYNYTFQQDYYIAFLSVFCENTKLCNRELVCPSSPYCIFDERLLTSFQVSNLGLAAMVVNFQMLLTSYLFPFIPVWSLQLSFHCLGIMSFSLGLDWRHILEGY